VRIGLVSDTHDNEPLVRVAAAFFRERQVDLVLHLGDVCEPETLALLEGLPVQAVRGNNDLGHALPDSWQSTLAGVEVFAAHGHVPAPLRAAIGRVGVALHGHTHKRRCETIDGTLVVNPGALHRAQVKSVALLELPARRVDFFAVDEAGARPMGASP